MKLTVENRSTRGKTCPSFTLSTTNPTWTDPGSNPGLRAGRPAANRLSHGTALRLSDTDVSLSKLDLILEREGVDSMCLRNVSVYFQ
jgi:hypothetical protein